MIRSYFFSDRRVWFKLYHLQNRRNNDETIEKGVTNKCVKINSSQQKGNS